MLSTYLHTEKISPWTKDVNTPKIIRHFLAANYPKVFAFVNKTLINRIKYKLYKFWYSITSKKRIYDKTFLWEKPFIEKVEEIITTKNIKNIIVTGAPFYLLYYVAKLADKTKGLNLIADYRDPWIGAANYGMPGLSKAKLNYEIEMQNKVAANFSYITAPNNFLLEDIKKNISITPHCNFIELPHVYDPDDFNIYSFNKAGKDVIKFVYGGTVYVGVTDYLIKLNNALDFFKSNNNSLYNKLRFEFYTPDVGLLSLFKSHPSVVSVFAPIGDAIFQKISEADFCMIMLSWHNKDYLTTKTIEFLSLRKPFFYFGCAGFVSKYITENDLGKALNENNDFAPQIEEIVNDFENNKITFNQKFDATYYSVDNISKIVSKILQ